MALEKSNLAPHPWPPAVAFRLGPGPEDPTGAIVHWQGEVEGVSPEAMLNPPTEEERGRREDARERLEELLVDGSRPAEELEAALRRAGHSPATIRRARLDLGITREAGTLYQEGFRGPFVWRLPTDAHGGMSTRGE